MWYTDTRNFAPSGTEPLCAGTKAGKMTMIQKPRKRKTTAAETADAVGVNAK